MLFITGLLGYHIYLVTMNITTKEELKHAFLKYPTGNPYKRQSNCDNWVRLFCCQKLPKKSTFYYLQEFSQ